MRYWGVTTHKHVVAKDIALPDHTQVIRAQYSDRLHIEHRVLDGLQWRLIALLEEDGKI